MELYLTHQIAVIKRLWCINASRHAHVVVEPDKPRQVCYMLSILWAARSMIIVKLRTVTVLEKIRKFSGY